jgi:hypothetical protein
MSRFDSYRETFSNARLTRSKTGVLEVALHTDGGTLVFNGYTHQQFVDLFHAIGSDPDNRVVILTGSGKLPSLTTSYTRIAMTQKLRRIIDEGVTLGLALEGISAADVARARTK